jgi:putative colanic acid biosynthesis acetyltransferase WcaF
MNTDPRSVVRKPYPLWTYGARIAWILVQSTLWRLAWGRVDFLRPSILRLFGARVPWRFLIGGSVRVYFPWLLEIGTNVAIADRVDFYNLGGIKIGNRAVISQDVYLCGGTHDYSVPSYPLVRKQIVVEDDVWIGAGAFIGPGVTIGRGAVVGARTVVFSDVPSWKVVIGNPARVLKDRVLRNP